MAAITIFCILLVGFVQSTSADDTLHTLVVLRGQVPGEHLGRSMAGVGDVNGDGLSDFLIGDTRSGWLPGQRRCQLYLGGQPLDVPSLVIWQSEVDTGGLTHADDDDHFGEVVDGGHDVNRDGFSDLVITSTQWYMATGKAYLYHGGFPVDTIPDYAIPGFGNSWADDPWDIWATDLRGRVVGDVNGDGCGEFVCLVAPLFFFGGAWVYFGGASMDSIHDLGLQGPGYPQLELGSCLASGDLNDDGYADLVVGSYGAAPNSSDPDVAWVYLGGAGPQPFPAVQLEGAHSEEVMYTVCIPGDMNGDGYDDVAVGDVGGSFNAPTWCRIYHGGAPMDSVAVVEFTGHEVPSGSLSLAGGDLNNDGLADLIVCESPCNPDALHGRLAIYRGGAQTDTIPDIEVFEPGGYFGETVAWIGDMTGDGWPEFAVSNPEADGGRGEIYIYTMGPVSALPAEVAGALTLRIAPNPAAEHALVSFVLSSAQRVRLGAYDAGGRLRGLVSDGVFGRGSHSVRWDAGALPPGVYVIRLETPAGTVSRRVVVGR